MIWNEEWLWYVQTITFIFTYKYESTLSNKLAAQKKADNLMKFGVLFIKTITLSSQAAEQLLTCSFCKQLQAKLYLSIIDDVIESMRELFLDEGLEDRVLDDLRHVSQHNPA